LPAKSRNTRASWVGSKEQQIKGLSKQKQISGKVQKGVGDVKQSVEDFKKSYQIGTSDFTTCARDAQICGPGVWPASRIASISISQALF
jgi:hypothetical protein